MSDRRACEQRKAPYDTVPTRGPPRLAIEEDACACFKSHYLRCLKELGGQSRPEGAY